MFSLNSLPLNPFVVIKHIAHAPGTRHIFACYNILPIFKNANQALSLTDTFMGPSFVRVCMFLEKACEPIWKYS